MINLDIDLPRGALLDGCVADLMAVLSQSDGTWLHGDTASFELDADGETLIGWGAMDGRNKAIPTTPNTGNGRRVLTSTGQGLRCIPGEHCGFVLPQFTERTNTFTMAVLFHDVNQADPRTLLSLFNDDKKRGSKYLFLSDNGSTLVVKDTEEGLVLEVPKDPEPQGLRCLMVSVCEDRIALRQGLGRIHEQTGLPLNMTGPASLFIGARSHRNGLLKTLGASVIEDVLFWPGHSLLMPRSPQDETQMLAFERYCLWRR